VASIQVLDHTKAIPVSDGSAWKNSLYASRPPAEAPIAPTGKALFRAETSFRLEDFFGEIADLDGPDFIFAIRLLLSLCLAGTTKIEIPCGRNRWIQSIVQRG
jgi:hypothetical protein